MATPTSEKKVVLELVGQDGNAFAVLGAFKRAAREQKFDRAWIDSVVKEAMSGDYDHLLATIIEHTVPPAVEDSDEFEDDGDDWMLDEFEDEEDDE